MRGRIAAARGRRGGLRAARPVIIPADIERKAANRQRKLREVFDWLDAQGAEVRALVAFFGWERVSRALSYRNPADVAEYLGDAAGFCGYRATLAVLEPAAINIDDVVRAAAAWKGFLASDVLLAQPEGKA